jgi:hypothetical protein
VLRDDALHLRVVLDFAPIYSDAAYGSILVDRFRFGAALVLVPHAGDAGDLVYVVTLPLLRPISKDYAPVRYGRLPRRCTGTFWVMADDGDPGVRQLGDALYGTLFAHLPAPFSDAQEAP